MDKSVIKKKVRFAEQNRDEEEALIREEFEEKDQQIISPVN